MKLSSYDFSTHQPYLEKNTEYVEYMPNHTDPLYGQVWSVYQVDHFDKNKSMAFPDICADLMVFYTKERAHSYVVSGTEVCRSMENDFDFIRDTETIFGVKFYPGKLNNFCVSYARDSGAMVLDADAALLKGRDTMRILEQATTFDERWSIISSFLLRNNGQDRTDPLVAYAANSIIRNRGNMKIRDMEEKTGYSNRYLRKRFGEGIGLTIKKFCEITKMQWAYELYQNNKGMKMIDLAMESGYYDQSHMNNTFKGLTGMLPKEALNMYIA